MLRMKKLFLLFFVCGLLIPAAAQLPRKINLGGQWEFRKAGNEPQNIAAFTHPLYHEAQNRTIRQQYTIFTTETRRHGEKKLRTAPGQLALV